MARVKAYAAPQVKAEDEAEITPSRRTRRQTKSLVEPRDASISEAEDVEEAEPARSPSPEPVAKPKPKRKYRKSNATKAASDPADDGTPEPAPQLAKDGRRKGGNKRKFHHEYCLTCENYGRACGGRREGEPGCAVCREPNREKGEKLRECLWANPEAGITTYKEAREVHKKAQSEAREQRVRAPKRPVPVADLTYERTPSSYLTATDPLGIVPHPRPVGGHQPRLSRPLNVVPPPTGTVRPSSINGYYTYNSPQPPSAPGNEGDTITVNTSQHARHQSHPDIQGVHRPQVINLPNGGEPQNDQPRRASMPHPPHYFAPLSLPPGLNPLPESYWAYYNPKMRAYIVPIHPNSNLLPPPAFMRDHAATYISPYDADQSLQVSMDGRNPPRPVFPTDLPPKNTGFSVPAKLKLTVGKRNPLDTSGTPCRKWSISDSKVPTLGGHEFKSKHWSRAVDGSGSSQELGATPINGTAIASNAVSSESGTRKSVESSELSSAIDVDESMLAATPQNNDGDEDMVEVVEIAAHDDLQQNADETESDEEQEQEEEEEPDRFLSHLSNVYKETINGTKRKHISSPAPAETAARFVAVNENYDGSDSDATDSEGEDKVVPVNARKAVAKAKALDDAWKAFSADDPKVQPSRGRAARVSRSSSVYEDAAEEPVRSNGFAAVNSGSRRKGATSLEHKRKIFADLSSGDVDMDGA